MFSIYWQEMCSVYTGEYALPGSSSLLEGAASKGAKRRRDPGTGPPAVAAPKRPSNTSRATAVTTACKTPVSNGAAATASRTVGAAACGGMHGGAAMEDLAVVEDTPDSFGGVLEKLGGADRGPALQVLQPGMVQVAEGEAERLRAEAERAERLQRDVAVLQDRAEAQTRRVEEQEATAAALRAELHARDLAAAKQDECLAAAFGDASAARAEVARLQTRADELAREGESLRKRVGFYNRCYDSPRFLDVPTVKSL